MHSANAAERMVLKRFFPVFIVCAPFCDINICFNYTLFNFIVITISRRTAIVNAKYKKMHNFFIVFSSYIVILLTVKYTGFIIQI